MKIYIKKNICDFYAHFLCNSTRPICVSYKSNNKFEKKKKSMNGVGHELIFMN
jgi:hypothetical protein